MRTAVVARRARLVGTAAVVGAVAGAVVVGALAVWAGDLRLASRKTFALGALVFAFGLLGWSGSAMAGRSFEAMQRTLDTGTNWTERDSRRAMARICGFGAGWMTGTSVVVSLVA